MTHSNAPILITGITGFIASHTAIQLLNAGHHVRGTMRNLASADKLRATLGKHAPVDNLEFAQAELLNADDWEAAMDGVELVHHIASPFPAKLPKDDTEIIATARDGALNVLRAAHEAGARRVVLTSSVASIAYGHAERNRTFGPDDWTDPTNLSDTTPYIRSKVHAERAAWAFVETEAPDLELVAINPSVVLGPVLDADFSTSALTVKKLLDGEIPALARWYFGAVDVRDVADAHVRAMTSPDAPGKRFIVDAGTVVFGDVAQTLREHFPGYAKKLPRITMPDFMVRAFALVDEESKAILQDVGVRREFDTSSTRDVLGWQPRPVDEAVRATAESLIALSLV